MNELIAHANAEIQALVKSIKKTEESFVSMEIANDHIFTLALARQSATEQIHRYTYQIRIIENFISNISNDDYGRTSHSNLMERRQLNQKIM